MQPELLTWTGAGKPIQIGVDRSGHGPVVLCLPALSSISTRRELAPLCERLDTRYRTISIDWPGFGDQPRPKLAWRPAAYSAFLEFVLASVVPAPHAVIAAGHGATYALAHACAHPKACGRLVLLAPTWRGPLPTVMEGRRPLFDRVCRIVDLPVVGLLLYRLNVNRAVVRMMTAGHVYADKAWLTPARLRDKLSVTRAPGARFSSVRFITGALDPLATRKEFLDLASSTRIPTFMVFGAQTPSRSLAEMEALAAVPGVRSACLPQGKLSVYEEFPDQVAQAIEPFLAEGR